MARRTWFSRNDPQPTVLSPSAWSYSGPTTDNTSESTSLTAAASVEVVPGEGRTRKKIKRDKKNVDHGWQQEAWDMYDQVGELRYVSNAIAGRMGQAIPYLEKDGVRVDGSEDDDILSLITEQMVERIGLNLFVAGGGWLAGLPAEPDQDATGEESKVVWKICSSQEVKNEAIGQAIEIQDVKYDRDKIYLVKIWDPHPARWNEADSPVRSSLPILRELVGLTQHVSAQIDSRLAGAGVYWIPNSILASAKVPETGGAASFSENPVLNAIMTAMLLPMEDRSNASAVVPLLLGAPDESISKIRFDSFSTPFDKNTGALREEAIRRLGLSLDAPPELLQGMGDANHWGMWLVRDEVIQTHVSPRLDVVADALTTGFYRPILKQVRPDEDAEAYEIKFDVSHLVQRPNRLGDAKELHAVNAIGDKALRLAGGFEETDAPSSTDRAIATALQVAVTNPQLLDNMPEIVAAIVALLDGTPATGPDVVQSQRVPGTLRPLAPGNTPRQGGPVASAPNGTPVKAAPVSAAEADGAPANPPSIAAGGRR